MKTNFFSICLILFMFNYKYNNEWHLYMHLKNNNKISNCKCKNLNKNIKLISKQRLNEKKININSWKLIFIRKSGHLNIFYTEYSAKKGLYYLRIPTICYKNNLAMNTHIMSNNPSQNDTLSVYNDLQTVLNNETNMKPDSVNNIKKWFIKGSTWGLKNGVNIDFKF